MSNNGSELGVSDATKSLASEIYALLDSIGATYQVKHGNIVVIARDDSVWTFTIPQLLKEGNR